MFSWCCDAQADNFLFEAVDEVEGREDSGGGGADLGWGSGGEEEEGDEGEEEDFGDIVDLDEM